MAKRLYDTYRWKKESLAFKEENPLCVYCQRQGRVVPAQVVDHITPHKGDEALFWGQDNWQALCKRCHDSAKQVKENKGLYPGCGTDGLPLDPDHPWNREGQGESLESLGFVDRTGS